MGCSGVYMHKETRRYLLDKTIVNLIEDLHDDAQLHTLYFTKIKLCKEIRYLHTPRHYTRITRSGTQQTQTYTYRHIPAQHFHKMRKKQKGTTLVKKRYRLQIDECQLWIDAYENSLSGLYILGIPHICQPKQPLLTRHRLLERFIVCDISEDPRYEEKYLALFGNPSRHPYNIYTVFKDLEHHRINDLQNVIFGEMKNADAIRIVLYRHFIRMHGYTEQIRQTAQSDPKLVENFHHAVLQSINIIKSFENIFDDLKLQRVTLHLNRMQRLTQTFRDLLWIQQQIQHFQTQYENDYLKKLTSGLHERIDLEYHKIARYFGSREYAIIKSQYELFLKEKNRSYTSYEARLPLDYILKIKYRNLYTELIRLIDFLDGCNDEASYEKIRTVLEEFLAFARQFQNQKPVSKHKKRLRKATRTYRLFEKYEQRNRKLLVLKMLIEHISHDANYTQIEKLLKKKYKKLIRKQQKLEAKISEVTRQFHRKTPA